LAQDEYYYEIQLTNKQLVFYFLAGATALVLSFLAGIMVGRGVDARSGDARTVVREETVAPVTDDALARKSPPAVEAYSYPQRLTGENAGESLDNVGPAGAARPTRATPTPTRIAAAVTPSPANATGPRAAAATPLVRSAATPQRVASATPSRPGARPSPTPRVSATVRTAETGLLSLQVGAFKDRASADAVTTQLRRKGYAAHVISPEGARGGLFNVRVGPYKTRSEAERIRTRLEQQEKFKPFIVKP
jgi:cell division septation protein DedD